MGEQPGRGPAVSGRPTYRMRGGTGGAPKGERNGAYQHGHYNCNAISEHHQARATMRRIRELVACLGALATNGE